MFILAIGAPGIPFLLIEEFGDDDLYLPLLTSVLLLVASLLVIRYLMTEPIRHRFIAKTKSDELS